MTDVRTFQAATMQEALDIVRAEMGSDAVILNTRQVSQPRRLPWSKPKENVEITAGLDVNIRSQSRGVVQHGSKTGGISPKGSQGTNRFQVDRSISKERSPDSECIPASTQPSGADVEFELGEAASRALSQSRAIQASLENSIASQVQQKSTPPVSPTQNKVQSTPPVPHTNGAFSDPTIEFSSKLDSIQKMLENLGRSREIDGGREIPNELFHLYTELIDADVEDDLARELIFRLRNNATPSQLNDSHATRSLMTAMVESEIHCCEPITPKPGRRKVVALVGPTGVGKTTTIAKLAANFRLRDGIKMGLVTVDTYRVAAVEQLRTYAEIIDLPMKVVTNGMEMRRALDELSGLDLVLIDTAGRSPRDELKIQELKTLLGEANVDEVHLVLSPTASMKSLEATAKKFETAGTTAVILTKLDEAAEMGTLLSVTQKIHLPISYLTTGQNVPDDIEPAHANRVARLVLGHDRLLV